MRGIGNSRTTVRALRGAFRFLTRIPVGFSSGLWESGHDQRDSHSHDTADWEAFRSSPFTIVIVGWVVGTLAAVPVLAGGGLPSSTVAFGYLLVLYGVTGIHHLDGVADLGDALVVHGAGERRREVLRDTTTGVGALLAVGMIIAGLALAGLSLATAPIALAASLVIAAEVGAKPGWPQWRVSERPHTRVWDRN